MARSKQAAKTAKADGPVTSASEQKLEAIYTGDSKNFHSYQIASHGFVGSVYVPKSKEQIPNMAAVELIGPADGRWIEKAQALLGGMSPNGKAYAKLSRAIADRKGG